MKQLADALADRIRKQIPSLGSEAAVLRAISEVRAGSPDYAQMDPAFAAFIRRQLAQIQAVFKAWGEVKSVAFKGVDATGADMYDVAFEKATASFFIHFNPDGKVAQWGAHPNAQ